MLQNASAMAVPNEATVFIRFVNPSIAPVTSPVNRATNIAGILTIKLATTSTSFRIISA